MINPNSISTFFSSGRLFQRKHLLQYILLLVLAFCFTKTQAQTAIEIINKSTEKVDLENLEMFSTLTILDAKGRKRIRKITTARKQFGPTCKMIMKFVEPADVKGTGLLVYDHENKSDDMWIYMPALRKVRRIVSKEKGKSFMGSEFKNSDMTQPSTNDFIYEIKGSENINGTDHFLLSAICSDSKLEQEYGYSKKLIWIEKNTFLTKKIIYHDQLNKPIREQYFSNYEKLEKDKYFARNMEMKNLKNGRRSIIEIEKFQNGSALSELIFTPAKLQEL